jgi:DNA repair protein RadC
VFLKMFTKMADEAASSLFGAGPDLLEPARKILEKYKSPACRMALKEFSRFPVESLQIEDSGQAYCIFSRYIGDDPRENFVILLLDESKQIIGLYTVAIGNPFAVRFSVCEILAPMLLSQASSCLCHHNHPSGDARPSKSDVKFAAIITTALTKFGMALEDSIVGGAGSYYSFKDSGKLAELPEVYIDPVMTGREEAIKNVSANTTVLCGTDFQQTAPVFRPVMVRGVHQDELFLVKSAEQLSHLVQAQLEGSLDNQLVLAAYDINGRLVDLRPLTGFSYGQPLDWAQVMTPLLESNAHGMSLALYRPFGSNEASEKEEAMAKQAEEISRVFGRQLNDFLLVTPGTPSFSFRDRGLLESDGNLAL